MTSFEWLQHWYSQQANGDWEHNYGIRISTLDNPGWMIEIDLTDTDYESITQTQELVEKNQTDWYFYRIENKIFTAYGDVSKLEFLVALFQKIITTENEKRNQTSIKKAA